MHVTAKLFVATHDARLLFVVGHWDNSLRVFNLKSSGRLVAHVTRHMDVVTCIALDGCGMQLITGSRDTTCMVWEITYQVRWLSEWTLIDISYWDYCILPTFDSYENIFRGFMAVVIENKFYMSSFFYFTRDISFSIVSFPRVATVLILSGLKWILVDRLLTMNNKAQVSTSNHDTNFLW